MKREEKATVVERLRQDLAEMPNLIVAEYRGLTVEQMTELRGKVRKAAGAVRVVKNTFLRRAVAGTPQEAAVAHATGPNAVILAREDLIEVAKVVAAADKEHERFVLKGGVLDGRATSADEIRAIAELPPRAVLLGRAVGSMASPLRGFVTVCQGTIRNIVNVLEAVRRQKEQNAA